ncbi:MAG: DUF5048 domain-containing protein [Clostridium sp.]|nr:DUF5048 domain-containing protein [Acetatifactor muris]MCM1527451.1 DUF5048 domain-containing protein [Bacteroides sp.]MCM1562103.1 DUF5048 domain-containing protein [Clostridium sp.]
MADRITQEDLLIVLRQSAAPALKLRIEVLDSDQRIIGTLECGLTAGSMSISGESDIRRTANFVVQPTLKDKLKLTENSLLWLNKDIRISIGLYHAQTREYKFYPLGCYVYTDASGVYDATTNNLTINCADFIRKLDGSKNGQAGALLIRYPAYRENEETGEVEEYYTIRNAVIETLESLAGITNHRIDDMGETQAMPEYNDNWQQYRKEHDNWNAIPFDQEFSAGCSILSILTAFRDLYPNYEMFFDMENNTFICQLKPLCYEDDILLDNDFLQRVLISENTSVDMTTVRNICEVWGKVIETDFYSEDCTYADRLYTAYIAGYEDDYRNGDVIALKIPAANEANAQININGLGAVGIYHETTQEAVKADELRPNRVYAFKIRKKPADGQTLTKVCLLGQWQVHAMNVLTNGQKGNRFVNAPDGTSCELYSKEYFQKFHHCDRVDLTIVSDSPFTVEKLGEIPEVKTGREYDNITSDNLAADRAKWENWKNCRLTDHITITTALLPFLDVNKKLSYRRSDSDREQQYIISSISHDFAGFTTTITMYRFYPSYEMLMKKAGRHTTLCGYYHGALGQHSHDELVSIGGE